MTDTKECNLCGELKPIIDFWKNKASPDGYRNQCRECREIKTVTLGGAYGGVKTLAAKKELSPLVDNSGAYFGKDALPGVSGVPLVLVIPDFDYTMQDTNMCPACNDYNVRFSCTLETSGIQIPILVCNDCIYKAGDGLVKFYKQGEMIYIIREYPTT